MSELLPHEAFPDVLSGEMLPATPENAHRVLASVKEMEAKLRTVKAAVTDYVLQESQRLGTKTIHTPGGDLVLTGGAGTDYDPEVLADCLREAGCPEERIYNGTDEIEGVIQIEQTFKVRRNVLKQLVAANTDYKAAAELAERATETPYRASAK